VAIFSFPNLLYQFPQIRIAGARQPRPAFHLISDWLLESSSKRRLVNSFAVNEASSDVVGTTTRELSTGRGHSSGSDGGLNSLTSNIFQRRSAPATASVRAKQSRGSLKIGNSISVGHRPQVA
jgi:hypothetical protein